MTVSITVQSMTISLLRTDLQRSKRQVGTLLLAMMFVACAEKPLPVSFTYVPDRTVQRRSGAESIHVEVTVNDVRQVKDSIGEATAGFRTTQVVTHEDLSQVIKSGIDSELINRGFELGPGNVLITIDFKEIAGRTKMLTWSGSIDARAAVLLRTEVKRKTGEVLYNKQIRGQVSFVIKDVSGSAASQQALDYALNEAVRNLVADPAFLQAVLSTEKPVKPAVSAASQAPTPVTSP